ncbi:MAG TPA: LutB/LldF family L-lactate oxidation iron-sulfur protein [Acidimicrobiales bacterium]|nr:LutB/LldF family L-lactate oxidation iron-sulfur protein [Acidimicrobiales bacterium]
MAEAAFKARAHGALNDDHLRGALRTATDVLGMMRPVSLQDLADPDAVRDTARTIRKRMVADLPRVLDRFVENVDAVGGTVFRAANGDAAVAYIVGIAQQRGARVVAKGKSMASEEIHLNAGLEAAGVTVVETDLGEFIIQLAGETPSHIIAPAIHKTRYDVAELFTADAAARGETGAPVAPDIPAEFAYARSRLREAFLEADIGVTGVNFAVAETGSICLVENEGNGRMCTTLPRVHIAVMGMERIVETWDELDVMLNVLARSATGQPLSVYTNILTGPRRVDDVDGPEELHVVILDNGRSAIRGTKFEDVLDCIRCGACLNVCPVYRNVGGHAYNAVYSGPIGAVLTPLLRPDDPEARELSQASSLCGACWEACPVRIPLHEMLLDLRARDAPGDGGATRRIGFSLWSWLWSTRAGFVATKVASRVGRRVGRRARRAPGWAGAWLSTREAPK